MTTYSNSPIDAIKPEIGVSAIDRNDLRVVKITTLRDVDPSVAIFAELKDQPDIIREVIGKMDFNIDKPLKAWEGDDCVLVNISGRGTIKFQNHTMGGPKYPITRKPTGIGANGMEKFKNVRVTFFVLKDSIIKPTGNVTEQPVLPMKPVRGDYDTQSAYMLACKKYHAQMREIEKQNA